jgi:hypothetical protein
MMKGQYDDRQIAPHRAMRARAIAATRQREADWLTFATLLFGASSFALLATSLGLMAG